MREIDDHKVNPANDLLVLEVLDEPGAGGANHVYQVRGYHDRENDETATVIRFQNGPIAEAGVNGLTQEVLLSIVADRLRSFQAGPFACRENALALTKIEEAQHWLQQRTLARMRRGVEGTHQK
ncbi:hypothetical protein [Aureimonas pseudogalii]|uniref:Acb2/Tad1 hairpin domain-containing protein n=1 Tax=Aureimonas pseudogalii TaxID=1744844 RepID=A0A7W6EEJ8_9HYPH|nr:hypothetical protein [Aureimonas pseudogalii]MBB3997200.1 hypothetical protein [Aureimonas pseudogalii]